MLFYKKHVVKGYEKSQGNPGKPYVSEYLRQMNGLHMRNPTLFFGEFL
jgi:hypothetical protein